MTTPTRAADDAGSTATSPPAPPATPTAAAPTTAAPTAPAPTTTSKAWAAAGISALLAFLSSIATALGGAETGFSTITAGQWITAVIAAVVAFGSAAGITYAVPNRLKLP
jgi:hypothetical protein